MKYRKSIFVAFLLLLALGAKVNNAKVLATNDLDWEDFVIDIYCVERDIRLS